MNFQNFFQLRENPFGETPDPRFFYAAKSHREALTKVHWAIDQNKAFIILLGEAGSGKTMMSRMLYETFSGESVAMIVNPILGRDSLLESIHRDFGAKGSVSLANLEAHLLEKSREGVRNILLVDECQALERDSLELIRLLTNLETSSRKLVQVVLIGQPELTNILRAPDLTQLQQRIFLEISLQPISENEMETYVRHRLEKAGGSNFVRFEGSAVRQIHRITRGNPRLINKICEAALRFSALHQIRRIDAQQIKNLPLRELGVRPGFAKWAWKEIFLR